MVSVSIHSMRMSPTRMPSSRDMLCLHTDDLHKYFTENSETVFHGIVHNISAMVDLDMLRLHTEHRRPSLWNKGAHTKRLLYKTSPWQNVSIQNVYTHNVSFTKRLLDETSPVKKRFRNKASPGQFCNGPNKLPYCNKSRIVFFFCSLVRSSSQSLAMGLMNFLMNVL
jgi:hypothetical protein